jgi:hypothetical protein
MSLPSHPQLARRTAALLLLLALAAPPLAAQDTPAPEDTLRDFEVGTVRLPDGYAAEVLVTGISVPTTLLFDGGDLLVAESGWVDRPRRACCASRPASRSPRWSPPASRRR